MLQLQRQLVRAHPYWMVLTLSPANDVLTVRFSAARASNGPTIYGRLNTLVGLTRLSACRSVGHPVYRPVCLPAGRTAGRSVGRSVTLSARLPVDLLREGTGKRSRTNAFGQPLPDASVSNRKVIADV